MLVALRSRWTLPSLLLLFLTAILASACNAAQSTATRSAASTATTASGASASLTAPGNQASQAIPPLSGTDAAEVATAWFDLHLKLIQQTPGFTPPVASRALGYSGVTLYEAVVPWMPGYLSLAGQLSDLTPLPKPEAGATYDPRIVANIALAGMARRLYFNVSFENKAAIDDLEASLALKYSAANRPDVVSRSVAHGQAVADAIYAWSRTDGGDRGQLRNFPTDYTPPAGPGLWLQTPRKSAASGVTPPSLLALQPRWGDNRPFVPVTGGVCDPGTPPAYSEDRGSAFYKEGLEVYITVKGLTLEQRGTALYWADDPGATATPPGHSISILTQVLRAKGASLGTAAEAYAKVGIAVSDAFVSCWKTKYVFNLLRPITYIQNVIDPTWNKPAVTDPVETPPFPEYPSGHSVQSAATAEVLTGLFGNVPFTDHTHDARGFAPRTYASFWAFANEAAISRLYGGIHYRAAIDKGLDLGKCIGARVNSLKFRAA